MDRYLGSKWSTQQPPAIPKPENNKLRRKLQKIGSQQRPYSVSYSDTRPICPETKQNKRASTLNNIFSTFRSSAPQRPPLPPSSDSDDGKWLADFRENGYVYRESRGSRQSSTVNCRERPACTITIVPEFAHLAVKDETPVPAQVQEKPISSPSRNGHSQLQTTRRYAKTPVLHIGQLETCQPSQDGPDPSIESIAEGYRALLESRNSNTCETPIEQAAHSEPFVAQNPSALPSPLEPVAEVPEPPLTRGSPQSDTGTLVAYDNDPTAYFKQKAPVSSVPSSPASPSSTSWSSYETASTGNTEAHNPDMRTYFNLLTNELALAVDKSSDTSALQIWVMIEAYEKLRSQVLGTREMNGPTKAALDTWIQALRSVHDGMTAAGEVRSVSDYGD